jgi:hypothetical protein
MRSVEQFVEESKKLNSLVDTVKKQYPQDADSLDKQLSTFAADVKKMESGQMSYSEMRRLYG